MCGIVGLFAKSAEVEERLGAQLGAMLGQMADRGPDSAGVALYRDPAPAGIDASTRSTRPTRDEDWAALGDAEVHASHAVVRARGEAPTPSALLRERARTCRSSARAGGSRCSRRRSTRARSWRASGSTAMAGSHGLGHTRMATESRR